MGDASRRTPVGMVPDRDVIWVQRTGGPLLVEVGTPRRPASLFRTSSPMLADRAPASPRSLRRRRFLLILDFLLTGPARDTAAPRLGLVSRWMARDIPQCVSPLGGRAPRPCQRRGDHQLLGVGISSSFDPSSPCEALSCVAQSRASQPACPRNLHELNLRPDAAHSDVAITVASASGEPRAVETRSDLLRPEAFSLRHEQEGGERVGGLEG